MAVKTITIDLEAYDALARHKQPGQSFSQVIKAHFKPQKTVSAFRRALASANVSDRTLKSMERVLAARSTSKPRVPSL